MRASELHRLYLLLAYNNLCSKCGSPLENHHDDVCKTTMGASKTTRYDSLIENSGELTEFLSTANLGKKLGFYRHLTHLVEEEEDIEKLLTAIDPYDLREKLGKSIIDEMVPEES